MAIFPVLYTTRKFHPVYKQVPFQEYVHKPNKVSLGIQLTQSPLQDCAVIGL